jgi:hypothetical protein
MALLNTNIGPERVQTFDQPLGVVQVPGAGTAVAGILISTSKVGAPTNSATRVTSLTQFVDTFGDADEVGGDGYYAVQGFFDNAGTGSTAIIVNVGETPTPADWIGDAATATGLRALDSEDDVTLVMIPGLPLEDAYLVHPAVIDYSETVRSSFGSELTTVFSLLSIPGEISRSQTDTLLATVDLVNVSGAGPYVLNVSPPGVSATGTITIVDADNLTGATITVDSVALVEGVDWSLSAGDNDATATALAAAITSDVASVSAAAVGAVITVTAAVAGVAGNSITLASNNADATVSAATLSGGLDGDEDLSELTAGMIVKNTAGSFTAVITAVNDAMDTITIATNPTTSFDADDQVHVYLPSAITYKESVINNPSRFASWYFNELVVVDRSSTASAGDVVQVDPVGHVAGVMARIDANIAIGGPSHAPAGIRYAGIAGISGLALQISEREDGGPLRLNFINRITSFPGAGNVIFGGYTADSGTSPTLTADEQLIQVMRTLQYIKASLDSGLRSFLWENFSPETQAQVAGAIQSFLRNNIHLFPAGLPEAQQFKVISVEPTQDELDQGLLRVRIQLRPNKAVRFIELALEYPIPVA